jgi:hypothetical protein
VKDQAEHYERQRAIESTVWFSVLVHSRRQDDFEQAARAQRELDYLGVQVRFRRPRQENADAP